MKYQKFLLLFALGTMPAAFGSVYVSDFSGANVGDPLNGVDGWVQSYPNPTDDTNPLTWINLLDGEKAGSIGAYYDEPTGDSYNVFRTVGGNVVGSTLTMDFGLMDSTNEYPDRNNFSISILDGGFSEVFSLNFTATAQSYDPESNDHQWNVSWSSGGVTSAPFAGVLEGGAYTYDVSFDLGLNENDDPAVVATLTISSDYNVWPTQTAVLSSVATNETFGILKVTAEKGDTEEWGDDFLSFRGVVPEPGVAMLVLLSGVGLLRRRR